MRCSSIIEDLLAWKIDRRGVELPPRLSDHLSSCETCRTEWRKYEKWVELLRTEDSWTPDETFYDRMIEQAMREKRRAALTESTRRDLALDSDGYYSIFARPGYRLLPAMMFLLIICLPVAYWWYQSYSIIGEFEYFSGRGIATIGGYISPHRGDPLNRNTYLQTPENTHTIINLENGAQLSIAPLSRVTIVNANTVHVDRGKVYFDIPPQHDKFYIEMPYGNVEVLGTAFVVEVDAQSNKVAVTRGAVRVTQMRSGAFVLNQGVEGILTIDRKPVQRTIQNIQSVTRWVQKLHEERNSEELRQYYPSLAAPTPSGKP